MERTHHRISIWLGTGFTLLLICTLAGQAVAQTCVQPPAGLVSWWPGEGNAHDIKGTHDGTLQNGATFVPGKVGQAFSLDGMNDYVDLGNWFNLQTFTIDLWVKAGASQVAHADIIDNNHSDSRSWHLNHTHWGAATGGSCCVGFPLTPGVWQHLAITRDTTHVSRVYLDGVLMGSAAGAGPIAYDGTQILRLARWGGGGRNWNGQLDEVAIYNRALTAAEIAAIFNAGSAGHGKIIANAGPDQTVQEGDGVMLDGSGSRALNNASLTYAWTQLHDPAVSLNLADPVHPTFVAPNVPRGGATLTFQLTVSNGALTSDPDVVNITGKDVNHAPFAIAGDDQVVQEGSPVSLHGAFSFDPDSDPLTYRWVQTAGPSVTLSAPTAAEPSFTAPLVSSAGATLTFELTVDDGLARATDTVKVWVDNVNHSPVAEAGVEQTKDEGSSVHLDGTASSDPDGDPLSYAWTQLTGPSVTLLAPDSATPNLTAPFVGLGGVTLTFQLVVRDGALTSAPDTVTITVVDLNDPPACDLAHASPDLLWPPNHKLVPVGMVGIADPNNDQVTVTVTGVTQDEPVHGLGEGDTSPDAVRQGDAVLLRVERAGNGNGRVYEVTFTADDSFGGRCTGTVVVCVPHERKADCVDDGQHDNSQ